MDDSSSVERFSTLGLPRSAAAAAWQAFMARAYHDLGVAPSRDWRAGSISRMALGAIEFATVHADGARAGRLRGAATPVEEMALLFPATDGLTIAQGRRSTSVPAGDVILLDTARPWHGSGPNGTIYATIKMPTDLLRARLGPVDDWCTRPGIADPELVSVARDFAATVLQSVTRPATAARLADMCIDLVTVLLDPAGRGDRRRSTALPDLIHHDLRAFMARHLADAGLSVDRAARACGIGKRLAQQLFQARGTTFGRELMTMRLDQADRLLRGDARGLPIGEIADACGFANQSHFATRFRRRFGITPRDARAQGRAASVEK